MSQYILTKLPIVSQVLCYYNGNLFTKNNGNGSLYSINITTGQYTAINSAMVATIGGQNIFNLATYNNCIYFIEFNSLYKQNISTGIVTREINNNANMNCSWRYIITCVYGSYIYYMASDLACIGRVNLDTLAIEGSWSGINSNYSFTSIVGYNNYLYFDNGGTSINRINVNFPTDVLLNFITSLPSTVTGLEIANNSLFVSTANNQIQRYGLSTPATNKSVPFATSTTITYAGTNYSTLNGNWSIVAANQSLYVINVTSAGVITKIDLPLQYNPYPTIVFDAGNTITVSSGNLKVSIIDPSNTLANGVYYQYAVNNNVYTTTGINAGNSPYTFYIAPTSPPLDISNTIYVIASNPVGDSTPAANIQVIVYQKPRPPPKMTLQLVQDGNIQIIIIESASTPIPYYYLNNVSYYCYVYNTFGGQNLSGNTSLLVYNRPIGILSNTNVTYGNVVSYINTGLNANTYTLYVIAVNQFGNSTPVSGNINVYVTPSNISFDTGNTTIVTSGNLKVTINDTSNRATNGIYYFYSVNGGATYANSNVPNNGPTKTSYTFYIPYTSTAIQTIYVTAKNSIGNSNIIGINVNSPYNTSLYNKTIPPTVFIDNSTNYVFQATGFPNKTYSLYLRGKNITGYSANSGPYSVTVYVTPFASINIDAGNTTTVASGNLQVRITDSSNTALNNVYYWYSLNNNVDASFANTYVKANVSPYSFYIPSITDISNTIYVRASNTVGNSSPATSLPVIVFKTPAQPQVSFQLMNSGNVQVSITESAPIPYYYLNNVSYSLYAYNTFGGNNLSGNTSLLVYNRSVGILANTNSIYGTVVSYINTGLNANTYTMYVIGTNSVGNSTPFSANIVVYTTPDFPPKIDAGNTISATAGNLTVSFTDPSNNTRNAISYWYYIYDPSAGVNNSGNLLLYSNTNLTLTTGAQQSFSLNGFGFINKTYTVYLRSVNPIGNSATASFANILVYTIPTDISIDTANVKTVASGNLQVVVVDPSNGTNNGVYYQYSVIGVNGNAWTNANAVSIGASTSYRFYIKDLSNATYTINVKAQNTVGNSNLATFSKTVYITPQYPPVIDPGNTRSTASGNLTISFTDTQNAVLNDISYSYYLFDVSSGGTNYYSNPSYYTESPIKLTTDQTLYKFDLTGYPNKKYAVYLMSKNSIGYSGNTTPYNAIVFVTPLSTINIDTGNTKTVAAGNLQVRITDLSNTSLNSVYYHYSLNGNTYANTNVLSGTSPYTFFIPTITDVSNTINVRASNTVGNSAPSANVPVIVFQKPTTPPLPTFTLVGSGNVQVSITETAPIPYYYLNNVSYYLYAYNTFGGNNLSGNTSLLVYNRSVGILANTNSTYGTVVSYVNAGLNANTFTMYVIAKNDFGNSTPISSNIAVYTTPIVPTIDPGNTNSTVSGTLTVSINDASNNANNGLYYYYSTDGQTYGNSGVAYNGNTKYKFTISNTGNSDIPLVANVYSLFIKVANPLADQVGNAVATRPSVNVYTTPFLPIIDEGNTKSTTSGKLTVSINDASNSSTNGLYYYYSTDGKTYGNSGVAKTTNTTYSFVINNTGNAQIPLVANVYSLYIQVSNPVGNAVATLPSVNVYTTPIYPPKIDVSNSFSATAGNLTVSFTDPSNNSRNVISYLYYVYDPSAGVNNSGNLLLYSNTNLTLTTGSQQSFSLNGFGFINKTYTVYLRSVNPIGNSATASFANILVYTVPTDISIDLDNTATISSGNLQVRVIDLYNGTNNGVYYQYLVTGTTTYANAVNTQVIDSTNRQFVIPNLPNGSLRVYVVARNTVGNTYPIYFDQVTYINPDGVPVIDPSNTISTTSGNLTVSFTDASNIALNNVTYYYYLYDISAGGTDYATNTYYYKTSSTKLQDGLTQYSFPITTGLGNKTYTLYLKANNNVGWSGNSAPYTVKTYTTPLATISFDTGNTKTIASGNLKVVIRDASNIAFNGVSYQYSIDGTTYIRSNVVAGTSPYSFYIAPTNPPLDISNTIYVRATNQVGNSSPAANIQVIVYQTPRTPPSIQFDLVNSGNVRVTIIESPTSRPDYYYLNNVSYSLYAYNTFGGNNLSGNTSLLVYNRSVGILANTNSTYGNVVSYINTGLNANTYTMYVIATNPFGNSAPFSANVVVYTTPDFPPKFDTGNTISATSGNLTVSFTDTSNNSRNAISYLYYVYHPDSGINDSGNLLLYSNSMTVLTTGARQSFTIYGYTNKTYTLYLRSVNPVGNSAASSTNVTIYTVPTDISIDTANVKTVASGNLQVVLVDPSNGTNNGVYYQYSVIGVNGNVWSNANAVNIGASTSYLFYISTGLTNQTYTINVKAQNTVGNSNPATFSKTVYITPQYPPVIDTTKTLSTASGNLTISFTDTQNAVLNDISYSYYLFDVSSGETNYYSNPSVYIESPIKLVTDTTLYSFGLSGFPNKTYTLYLRSKNSIGYSANTAPFNVTVFVTPIASVGFDAGNTQTIESGNLQVTLVDPSNTELNQVYYWYSTTTDSPEAYSNSYVKSGVLPYRFYIENANPLLDISSTIYIKAVNTVGNSFPAINKQVIVYQTPYTPTNVTFDLVNSGNVQVVITENSDSLPDYYYLNNVSYYLYAFNNRNSIDTLSYEILSSYTYSVGKLTSINSTYEPIVSYVNTGLTANAYTMYVIARNDFGYSGYFSQNIDVFTTPLTPTINTQTTISATSGNLTVSFTDTVNIENNGIRYLYYMYDPSYANVGTYIDSGRMFLAGGITQSFDIYGYTNKIYTLYLLASNPIGNSAPYSTNVTVYTNPLTPTRYDTGNIKTVSSGNLQVSFYDTVNPALNSVYYWYSTDNGYTYSNSRVKNIDKIDPYEFVIYNLPNIRTNLSILAADPVGNSAPLTDTFTVLQTPRTPDTVVATLVQSGNVLLTVRESSSTPPANYHLNNVSYYYYLYTEGVGDNLSNSMSSYTNYIGSATNSNYPDISIYVNGLPNKTSTFYVIAKNDVGNSAPKPAPVTVYIAPDIPPSIDSGNTYTVASGNLQVSLIDTINTATNNAYYWYSINGGSTYIPTYVKNNGPSTSSYVFWIPDLSNQDYTVSVIARNTVGSSAANTITKRVYITPQFAPVIDRANSQSYSANYLTVTLDDTQNMATNDIRYLYYLYDNSTPNDNNLSGNISLYKDSTKRLLVDGTTKYSFDVSGLVNTTYTLYLLAKNTVGNSSAVSTDIIVYTIPAIPSIDPENTKTVASGNVRVTIIDTSNIPLNDVYYWYSNDGGNIFANTNIKTSGPSGSPYIFNVSGLQNQTYTWSIMAKNTVGNVISSSVDVVSYTKPFPVRFDDGNTYSVASGNLQVTMVDPSNIALNEVYYKYSIDGGNTYANTDIKNVGPAGSPYIFWIPDLSNQMYTVSIKSVNRIDESVISTISKMVYITPQYSPTLDLGNTISATSGNLIVAFDDTNNLPSNNIQYWYYLYDPSNNQNDWFNPGAYTYTTKSLATNGLGPTHFTFGLSNLTNKTYTIYLLSKNTVGTSSIPVYANLVVYTKPVSSPIVDSANTRTAATGNLLVSFTDTVNRSLNDIYYWYSTNGGTLYANSFVKNAGPDQTAYSFYIPGLTNSNTTLSIYSKNTVGNSTPSTATIKVYTTPLAIQTIDSGNTKTVSTGNLQVTFTDTTNTATNDVYYWYSTYSTVSGDSTYANSLVKNAGPAKSTYMFYINDLTNTHTAVSIKTRNSTDLYIGDSASVKANVIVYTTPEQLSSYSISSSVSGNIRIAVNDTNNSPTNEVYYYVYYYRTGDTGPNNSTNISVYSNTYTKRTASSTTSTFYLNDLSNNQYTVYVATKNNFGSNIFAPALTPIQVYVTPIVPTIDNANTLSYSSGNLTVSIIDTVNLPTNAVYYWYSINGGVYGNSGISKISGVSQYSYNIPTTQISNGNVYIVRVKTVNPISESTTFSVSNPLEVYTTPEIPLLYSVVPQDSAIDVVFSVPYNNGNAISRYEYILTNVTANSTSTKTLNATLVNTQNTARISGVTNGTTYSVGVRAVNNRGPSGLSSTQSVIPFGVPFSPGITTTPGDRSITIDVTPSYNNGNAIVRYEYSLYGGSSLYAINTIEITTNSYTVTGLENGTTYNVVVRAVNARGLGDWSSPPVQVVPYTNPGAPAVKLESLSGAFRIYFDTPYDGGVPISYFQYTLDNGSTFTQFGSINNNSVIVSNGVVDGTLYTVRVQTFNTNGRFSGLSTPVSVTPFSVPVSPILRTAEAGIGTIPISFSASTYNGGNTITRYEYSTDIGNSFSTMGLPTITDSNGYITYEITYQSINGSVPLVNGTPYTIQLRAVNARGPSTSPSGSITVVPFNRPDPPTLLSAIPNNHIINVSFSAPASDGGNPIQSYEYSINGGDSFGTIPNIDITAKQMQFTVSGLENGNVFSVYVRSRNSRGTSENSNMIEATPYGIPDPPIIRGVSKNTRVDIVFNTPNRRGKALVGYEYFVSPIFETYSRISSILPLNDLSQNVFTIYGLNNGQTYTVYVTTVNSVGTSEISNIVEIAPSTTPEAPTIRTAVPLPGAIDVIFNTVANTGGNTITGYKYAYHLGGV